MLSIELNFKLKTMFSYMYAVYVTRDAQIWKF